MKTTRPITGAAALLLIALTGCAAQTAEPSHEARVMSVHHALKAPMSPVEYAAVGDSITAGYGTPGTVGTPGWDGWPEYAQTARAAYLSGWFQVGLRSDQIVDGALSRELPAADVLVVMGCTNDILQGYDFTRCFEQWDRLDAATDMPMIVSAIAPSNVQPSVNIAYNAALAERAAQSGWIFVDPYAGARAADGTYLPGAAADLTVDGVHPSVSAQQAAGTVLEAVIFAVGSGSKIL